jgi:catecholate siderophore receptor
MNTPSFAIETKSLSQFCRRSLVCAGFALLAHPALAQAPATPSYLPDQAPALVLEKFSVNGTRTAQAYAADHSVTATKTDTALVNVPQAITVITRELIDDQGMRSLGDLTRYVPGVGIAQGEGNRDTPVLRGNSTTADFFVDGLRDDVQYFRDFYNVDRVEVLKGPNAMIFGRGGSGGVINRVTKQANGVATRALTLQAGSWDQYRATLDLGQSLNARAAFRVTALYEDAGSYRDGVTLNRSGVNPNLSFKLSDRTSLRAGYEYFHDERVADRGVPSFQGRAVATSAATFFGDPAQSASDATVHTVFATLDHRLTSQLTLRNSTRYGHYTKFYQNVFPGSVNAAGDSVSISAYQQTTERANWFNQTDLEARVVTGSVQHQLLTGLELARQETDNLRLTGYFTTISPTTTTVSVPLAAPRTTLPLTFALGASDAHNHGVAKTVALYAQDQITLSARLQAIVGVRWEQLDVDFLNRRTATPLASRDGLLSPRAGLIYKPADAISLYASYSTTYVPRAGEQLASLSATNRSLDPEEFTNYELGAKWTPRADLAFTAAVYRLDRSNVAIPDPANPTQSLLVDGQRAHGVELGLTGRLAKNWSVAGGYAYQDGEIKTTQSATIVAGARLAQLPRHTFSLWNRYDFNRRWGAGLGVIYRDELFASTDNLVRLPGFTRCDLAIFHRVSDDLQVQLNVENLLDRAYFASAHNNNNLTPGSPRALRLSVTTQF